MLLKLISPYYPDAREKLKDVFPHMALAYLAGLTPPDWEVTVCNESKEDIDFDEPVDLVGISFYTYLAPRAYVIAQEYRQRGIPVVMGGIHPSTMPEEALQYADAVVIGEAELVWKNVLDDAKNGKLQRKYQSDTLCDLKALPVPRFDLFELSDYVNCFTIFTTKGCPFDCNYCSIGLLYGTTYRKRPIDAVLREITFIKDSYMAESPFPGMFFFIDDNLWIDKTYAKEFFKRLIPLHIQWISQGSIGMCDDKELLALAAESGCQSMESGFETLHPGNLEVVNKGGATLDRYAEMVENLHALGIAVQGTFMVGLPCDDVGTMDKIFQFVNENEIEYPNVFISTPFPGTRYFNQMEKENRILTKDWSKYDFRHLVFKPARMTPQELKQEYVVLNQKIFSQESINKRLKKCSHFWIEHVNMGKHKMFCKSDWENWINE